MQGFQNGKLDKGGMKKKHSLKRQHKLGKFCSESKIFIRAMSEIPLN